MSDKLRDYICVDRVAYLNELAIHLDCHGYHEDALRSFNDALHFLWTFNTSKGGVNHDHQETYVHEHSVNLIFDESKALESIAIEQAISIRDLLANQRHTTLGEEIIVASLIYNTALSHFRHGSSRKAEELLNTAFNLFIDDSSSESKPELPVCPTSAKIFLVSIHLLGMVQVSRSRENELRLDERSSLLARGIESLLTACSSANSLVGPDHKMVASLLSSIGHVLSSEGFPNEASVAFEEASKIYFKQALDIGTSKAEENMQCSPAA